MNILKILTSERKTGNLGELRAVKLLKRKGYKILERNYVACGAEIDIIAKKRGITAFVEVKTRNLKHIGHYELRPASSVTPEKQQKIIKVANYYRRRHMDDTRIRFDVIEVYLEDESKVMKVKDIKHLESAFNFNTAYDGYHPKSN